MLLRIEEDKAAANKDEGFDNVRQAVAEGGCKWYSNKLLVTLGLARYL